MEAPIEFITDAEWEVMRVIWTQEKTTSREVIALLNDKMNWKPSTVKTLLSRLVDKGYVETQRDGKKFIYSPTVSEKKMVNQEAQQFFQKICHRKAGQVLAEVMATQELSQSNIEQLEDLLNEKKKTAPIELDCQCSQGQCHCQSF